MKTKRELQFLTYLDALERGDAEGISAFLALAEVDAELEKMLMDYHNEESPEETITILPPNKRKRKNGNRWLQGFGSGLVAGLVLLLVGAGMLMLWTGNIYPYDFLWDRFPVEDTTCRAEIVRDENQITLLAAGDLERTMTVGVNNPFIVMLGRADSGGYTAVFEGLRVTIAKPSLRVTGDCSNTPNITVYPKDNPDRTCQIEAERLLFPTGQYLLTMESLGKTPYDQIVVLLDEPVNGAYPIQDHRFEGSIPAEYIRITGNCSSFPLLYVQPAENVNMGEPRDPNAPITIDLSSIRVTEQRFEHGAMFQLEPINQLWVACAIPNAPWTSWQVWPFDAYELNLIFELDTNPPERLYAPQWGFVPIWESLRTGNDGTPICDLGWALDFMETYQAPYEFEPNSSDYYDGVHSITSSTGDVYRFYEASSGEHYWRLNGE